MVCVSRFLVQRQSNPCVDMSESRTYKSINQRYPGVNGKLLRDQVDSDFVIESNRTLRFLDSNGKPLLRAHDLNERNQGVVIEEYVAGILEHGLIADVRSKPICNCAIYEAHRREPDNKQVWDYYRTNTGIGTSSRQPSQISGHTGSVLIRARQPGTSWIVFSALNHCTSLRR